MALEDEVRDVSNTLSAIETLLASIERTLKDIAYNTRQKEIRRG